MYYFLSNFQLLLALWNWSNLWRGISDTELRGQGIAPLSFLCSLIAAIVCFYNNQINKEHFLLDVLGIIHKQHHKKETDWKTVREKTVRQTGTQRIYLKTMSSQIECLGIIKVRLTHLFNENQRILIVSICK